MNIVLVGFMGTGKTQVGRKVAQLTGLKYISTDQMIEEREGKTIPQIFEQSGEGYFREVERKIVAEVSKMDGLVIDAGGGVVLREDNVKDLKANGVLICLEARPEVIFERMKDKMDRPLLNVEDRLSRIRDLLEKRKPYYAKADYFIDTSDLSIEEVANRVIQIYEQQIRKKG
jgi:shikimate kinase